MPSKTYFEFSEPEELTWEEVSMWKLPFGKYKAKPVKTVLRTKEGRDYLRYLLSWQELRQSSRDRIDFALEFYKQAKAANASE